MASINSVIISGRLVKDPQIRDMDSFKVAQITVVVSRKYQDKNKNWQEEASFIDCSTTGKKAELIAQYLAKGSQVTVQGRLKQEKWTDKETGKERSRLNVVIEEIVFAAATPQEARAVADVDINTAPSGYKQQAARPQQRQAPAQRPAQAQKLKQPQAEFVDTDPFGDSDLPF